MTGPPTNRSVTLSAAVESFAGTSCSDLEELDESSEHAENTKNDSNNMQENDPPALRTKDEKKRQHTMY
jgi:hypothetical protein